MLKMTSVFLFVVVFVTGTMHAQTLQKAPQPKPADTNLKQVFKRETEKIKDRSAVLDAKELAKSNRPQAPKKSFLKNGKFWLVVSLVALVGLAVVLAYNSKRCIRRDPEGCDLTQYDCKCLEYAP